MATLVTGGAGYVGSVTVAHLLSQGQEVVVLDNLSMGHRLAIDPSVPFYEGDIGDRALLARILKDHPLDSCIHFAALTTAGESVRDPLSYFENNVEKGLTLLETLLQAGVKKLVFSSSCAIYGEQQVVPIAEGAQKWPKNPYGWTKLFFEQILESCDVAYGLKFVALRYFNVAGASATHGEVHDPESHLIANVLRVASGKLKEIVIFGHHYPTPDGTAIRDYIHVTDLAEGHALALKYLQNGGTSEYLNLGSGVGHSVLEVIDCVRKITGRPVATSFGEPRPGDPPELIAEPGKAQRVLGWSATRSDLPTIIRSAWEWSQQHPRGYTAN